jgi:hypothetical protein
VSTSSSSRKAPAFGDYVLATKYGDGDPGDHWCIGWLARAYDLFGETRYIVVVAPPPQPSTPYRATGFRRCERITKEFGEWAVAHTRMIEQSRWSIWGWRRRWRSFTRLADSIGWKLD